MSFFTDNADFSKHILVRSLLDVDLLEPYVEVALETKVYPFIPRSVIDASLADTDLKKLIKRTVAHYTIPIAIPFLKVQLSNAGINTLADGKLKAVSWWDVRDMALQSARIADETLTDLIDKLKGGGASLPFLDKFKDIIFSGPKEFFQLAGMGQGYDLYNRLLPTFEYVWLAMIKAQLPECVLTEVDSKPELSDLLKKAVAFYSMDEISTRGDMVFTTSGLFVQWEQLPWQQSAILNETQLARLRTGWLKKGNTFMQLIWEYLKKNATDFPCLDEFKPIDRTPIIKKSGLYL